MNLPGVYNSQASGLNLIEQKNRTQNLETQWMLHIEAKPLHEPSGIRDLNSNGAFAFNNFEKTILPHQNLSCF